MDASPRVVAAALVIPTDHRALPGHFPGNPVVPGVVVLDHVIRILETSGVPTARLRRLQHVKFIEPLLPGQTAVITAEVGDAGLSFRVTRDDRTIVKGAFGSGSGSAP